MASITETIGQGEHEIKARFAQGYVVLRDASGGLVLLTYDELEYINKRAKEVFHAAETV